MNDNALIIREFATDENVLLLRKIEGVVPPNPRIQQWSDIHHVRKNRHSGVAVRFMDG